MKKNPSQIEMSKFYQVTNQTLSNWKKGNEGKQRMLQALREFYIKQKQKGE